MMAYLHHPRPKQKKKKTAVQMRRGPGPLGIRPGSIRGHRNLQRAVM